MNNDIKLLIHRYGAFTVIVLALFFLLATFTLLSRNTWKTKLKESVEAVLTEKCGALYKVGDYIPLETPATVSTVAYKIVNTENNQEGKAILIRVTGISGPTAAVYTYFEGDEKGIFIGYAANTHFVSGESGIDFNASENQLNYCARQIPLIVSKGKE